MLSPETTFEKVDVFGVTYSVTDYRAATEKIMSNARERQSFGVSALAVHGLMEAVYDEEFRAVVGSIDMVVPDGQPVRWAMNLLHKVELSERVYGPDLAWHVIAAAASERVPVFLFGSTHETCLGYAKEIQRRHPEAIVAFQPDRFREATPEEDDEDVARINDSGAGVVLVGRGCPRQERWVVSHCGRVHAAMLAVGAAFDYGAGNVAEPPQWMQRAGLQWLYRLAQDPRRLWRRYAITNTRFVLHLGRELVRAGR